MKVKGVWAITNTASLHLYEIKHNADGPEDAALIGVNNENPKWMKIHYSLDGAYIMFGRSQYNLNECMRV